MSNATINTRAFVATHQRAPKGRGLWAFSFQLNGKPVGGEFFSPSMTTFAEAKKLAKAEAAKLGANTIIVLA